MTPEQIILLRSSFERLRPISEQAVAMFYDKLFELAPELRPLFKGDIRAQGRKLTATLASVMNALDEIHLMLPAVRNLGRRHTQYGVAADHYVPVRDAMLWTLERTLGALFTEEVRQAWEKGYTLIAEEMLQPEPPSEPT